MFNDKAIFHFTGPWGLRIEIGQSILMLVAIFVFIGNDIVHGLIFVAMLLVSIFLHELGHAWGALVQGIPVRRVMLYGGGGFCQAGRSVSRQEDFLFTICGPLVNLALWAISGILVYLVANYAPTTSFWNWVGYYLWEFGRLNIILLVLNMFPVLPLDGGRLFHLLMCRIFPDPLATKVAGGVGLVVAVLWIPAMIALYTFAGWLLLFIPPFRLSYNMLRHGVTGGSRPV